MKKLLIAMLAVSGYGVTKAMGPAMQEAVETMAPHDTAQMSPMAKTFGTTMMSQSTQKEAMVNALSDAVTHATSTQIAQINTDLNKVQKGASKAFKTATTAINKRDIHTKADIASTMKAMPMDEVHKMHTIVAAKIPMNTMMQKHMGRAHMKHKMMKAAESTMKTPMLKTPIMMK